MNRFAIPTVIAVLTLSGAAGAAKPKIVVSQDVWEFGTIWHGEKVNKEIKVTNEGDAELKVDRIRASCGCTASTIKKSVLAPGESSTVDVSFDSAHKNGDINTQVNIFSNDPDRRQVTIQLKGHVNRELQYEPLGGCVSRVLDKDSTPVAKCTVRNVTSDQQMKLALTSVESPKFEVTVREVEPGKVFEVLSTAKPPFQPGRQSTIARFSTGLQREKELVLTLVVDLIDRIQISPPAVFLDPDMIRSPTTRNVNLMYYGSNPEWKVEGVESSSPLVTAQAASPHAPNADYLRLNPAPTLLCDVTLQCPAGADLPKDGVMLTVRTNEPGFEQLQILVTSNSTEFSQIVSKNRR